MCGPVSTCCPSVLVLLDLTDTYLLTGAGNKLLTVLTGLADMYVITTESNVVCRWDTCAGHAQLRAHGGLIISYKTTLDALCSYRGDLLL